MTSQYPICRILYLYPLATIWSSPLTTPSIKVCAVEDIATHPKQNSNRYLPEKPKGTGKGKLVIRSCTNRTRSLESGSRLPKSTSNFSWCKTWPTDNSEGWPSSHIYSFVPMTLFESCESRSPQLSLLSWHLLSLDHPDVYPLPAVVKRADRQISE